MYKIFNINVPIFEVRILFKEPKIGIKLWNFKKLNFNFENYFEFVRLASRDR